MTSGTVNCWPSNWLSNWQHWLEGANHSFKVITDHKNLKYLREAKCLNPRQAHWALFFNWFHLTVTYCPGPKKIPKLMPSPESTHQTQCLKGRKLFSLQTFAYAPLPGLWMTTFVLPQKKSPLCQEAWKVGHMYPHNCVSPSWTLYMHLQDLQDTHAGSESSHSSREGIGGQTWPRTLPDL